ncbi:hypothetical protein BN7_3021 [Wickerhamomyces ciferrii]|uniref:Ubiquitin-like domain-containing protein n=1 Tax=Wickerhamomyces ciferrii (strain ATCC 14091 / BCRC 22168 / CBS 111 / JCM 3599 / NBRC 0793 / NRRL Y-1031 F-60-10) TaxID=1206466 RepID=K0KKH3_WICCF|nr:uncharacterized protein BN7_3021 [Wickerhamomyces ciferrii]CCH43471.1 hypothetical protein BN7_3021 [Wickerhamomyces ciferrii]
MSFIIAWYNKIESIIISILSSTEFSNHHLNNEISKKITVWAIIILVLILIYKLIFQIGVNFQLWELPGKEFFIDKPVHCAHVYVDGYVITNGEINNKIILSKPLNYHLEFTIEDFENNKDPELGCTLEFTRKKLYFLFKDSSIFQEKLSLKQQENYKINDVLVYHKNKLLKDDNKALCLLGVETGNRLKVYYNLI